MGKTESSENAEVRLVTRRRLGAEYCGEFIVFFWLVSVPSRLQCLDDGVTVGFCEV